MQIASIRIHDVDDTTIAVHIEGRWRMPDRDAITADDEAALHGFATGALSDLVLSGHYIFGARLLARFTTGDRS